MWTRFNNEQLSGQHSTATQTHQPAYVSIQTCPLAYMLEPYFTGFVLERELINLISLK